MNNSNVIPLFGRKHPVYSERPRNEASTHFLRSTEADASMFTDRVTLCGREAVAVLAKDSAHPECEACIEEHARLTGWSFPLPVVVCTA
jgi:hypothetical protein